MQKDAAPLVTQDPPHRTTAHLGRLTAPLTAAQANDENSNGIPGSSSKTGKKNRGLLLSAILNRSQLLAIYMINIKKKKNNKKVSLLLPP